MRRSLGGAEPNVGQPGRPGIAATASRVMRARPRLAPFFLVMATVFIAVVSFGFANTIPNRLIHPKIAPPLILWVHATLFIGWITLFFTQSLLVRVRHIRAHRRLGIAGLVVGSLIPIIGFATSLVMDHINIANKSMDNPQFLAIQLSDLACFTLFFALAGTLRGKPAVHRRLMFVATCVLMSAALARFPSIGAITNDTLFFVAIYAGADVLVACGLLKDLIEEHNVSAVYRYGLPFLVIAQCTTVTLYLTAPTWFVAFARHITAS